MIEQKMHIRPSDNRTPINYSAKLTHVQVVINCRYSVAQMCTREDTLAHYLGMPFIDDFMRYNALITLPFECQTSTVFRWLL